MKKSPDRWMKLHPYTQTMAAHKNAHASLLKAAAKALPESTDSKRAIAFDGHYTLYTNETDERWTPKPGIVVQAGHALIAKDGIPSLTLNDEGICILSATEPVEAIIAKATSTTEGQTQ